MFRRVSIRLALFVGDLGLIAFSLYLASWLRIQLGFGKTIDPQNVWPAGTIYLFVLLTWGLSFLLTDVYNLRKNLRFVDELQRLIVAHAIAVLSFAGILYFTFRETSRLQILLFALVSLILLLAYRIFFRLLLSSFGHKRYGARRILIVGANDVGREAANAIEKHRWTGLRLVGFVDDEPLSNTLNYPRLGTLNNTVEIVQNQNINEVILALSRQEHSKMANLVADLHKFSINVRVVPDFFDLVFLRAVVEDLADMPLITLKEPVLNPLQRLVKRTFDLILGVVALLLSLPLMAFIAIGIKLDTSGPILFCQQRVGENGRLFDMYKFRTMFHLQNADYNAPDQPYQIVNDQVLHKFYDDPRVTRLGRFLRRTSLDELPQFLNIVKGDMSLVGPRPELPLLVDRYEPWQRKRFEVPQGLTGWWQVNGRADKPMHLNTQDDLYYIKNYSLWLDIQILWRTIGAVFSRRGSF